MSLKSNKGLNPLKALTIFLWWYFMNYKKEYGDEIEFVLKRIEELRRKNTSNEEYLRELMAIVYTYIPRPCLYKGDTLETILMINNNDLKTIKNCLL